jgi:hypothetical protein
VQENAAFGDSSLVDALSIRMARGIAVIVVSA